MTLPHDTTTARRLHKLPANILKKALPGKFYGDGGGLWLIVSPTGGKQWEFRFSIRGRVRHKGLGSAGAVSLALAREKAAECRSLLAKGIDPIGPGKAAQRKTFAACALDLIQSKESGWRNHKHAKQWGSTILQHCQPILDTSIDEIDTAVVLGVLKPVWQKIPETASRLRGRIEAVLDFAKAHGWRSGENPAMWRGHLASILPKRQTLSRGHHRAMPYDDVAAFIAKLREKADRRHGRSNSPF